jgi:PGF-CTERM protein
MNGYRILALLGIACLLLAALIPVASARFATPEGPNAGINIGDTVFLGERNVNFSAFADPEKGDPVRMVRLDDSGQQTDPIAITNNIANYIRGSLGQYYPVYTDGTYDKEKYCLVQDVASSLGQMEVHISETDVEPQENPCRPGTIPYRMMAVQFLLPDLNLPFSEFQSSWYEYELRGVTRTDEIINTAGTWVSLKDLSANPAERNETLAFRLSDQDVISPGKGRETTMVFRLTLNDLNYELPYRFEVRDYQLGLELSDVSAERGDDLTLTVRGMPFMLYDIKLPIPQEGENYPRFGDGGWHEKISDYHVRAYPPEWDGEVRLTIDIPEAAPITSYRVSATGPGAIQPVTADFDVVKKVVTLVFDEPEEKQYVIGDTIELSGTLRNIKSSRSDLIPIYLFVTGPNLPANGAPLTDPRQGVVDGEPGSFTVAYYNPTTGRWEYNWETLNFHCEEGTYTVYANLQPIGYRKSCYPGASGSIDGEVPPSWEYALSSPTVHAKFDEETGGVFARGDFLYSWWYARGSPGSEGATSSTGHMKWYIFGPNFKYADCNPRFPLDDDGTYGITYSRNFTYELSPGDYFIVYHHPGLNNQFDVLPENNLYFKGPVRKLFNVDDGRMLADLGNLDSKNAATALLEALDSVNNDDIYVMDTFTIEDPLIWIRLPGELVVGDELVVEGTTNLAGEGTTADGTNVADTLTLTITSLDLYESGKANTVMKIPVDDTVPEKYDPVTGARSFSYDSIDTSTWYPGKYMVTVRCKDVNHKETCAFELLAEGSQRNTMSDNAQNPFPRQTPATPASTPYVDPEFTPISLSTTQSPGFEALIAVIAVFGALIMMRRR